MRAQTGVNRDRVAVRVWGVWLLVGALWEVWAWRWHPEATLSAVTWRVAGIDPRARRSYVLRPALLAFCLWLGAHLAFGWWVLPSPVTRKVQQQHPQREVAGRQECDQSGRGHGVHQADHEHDGAEDAE